MKELTLEAPAVPPVLAQATVAQAMHPGLITCGLETPLAKVAELMATHHIHAVVAFENRAEGAGLWGIVSDLDLARATLAADFDQRTAGGVASTPVVTIAGDESLATAVVLMEQHRVSHVVVVSRETDWPIGILSTLDVARTVASRPRRKLLARNAVVRALTGSRIDYDLLPHRETMTARAEAEALGAAPEDVAKTIVLRTEFGYVRAVVPASERLDIRKVRDVIGEDVRFAAEDELVWAYPQFELGAVPPIGGPGGDRVVVDRRLASCERLVFECGVHDESVRVRTDAVLRLADADIADLCRE